MNPFLNPKHSAFERAGSGRQSGAAMLPIIIGVAVAITLLQVPLLYKTNSGNKFSGTQKSNITAKSLAEAGIDELISDIGRKALAVNEVTDTMPYVNVGLGRGNYTTRVRTYQANPYRVEVVSTGHIGTNTQTVRAKMELVKTLTTIPYDTPRLAMWGIRGTPPTLYYHSLEERDSGWAWIHPEGEVQIPGGGTLNIDDFTVAPNGTMYFINNVSGSSDLYKIRPTDLDNNPSTPVIARLVGPTGLKAGTNQEIRGLTFIAHDTTGRNGVLFAVTWKSQEIFELNLDNGTASFVSRIIPKNLSGGPDFWCDAMSQDLAGTIYIVRNNGKSELWRFDEFVEGPGAREDSASIVAEITNSSTHKVRALAGHPNGYMYATNDQNWFRINPFSNPVNKRTSTLFADSSDLHGIGFHYEREDLKFTGRPIAHKINICHYPPGNCANVHTIQIDSSALNAHMNHGGVNACAQDTPGYCSGGLSVTSISDTTIQLKIISWEEVSGDLAKAH
jgi:hypothetical protein